MVPETQTDPSVEVAGAKEDVVCVEEVEVKEVEVLLGVLVVDVEVAVDVAVAVAVAVPVPVPTQSARSASPAKPSNRSASQSVAPSHVFEACRLASVMSKSSARRSQVTNSSSKPLY